MSVCPMCETQALCATPGKPGSATARLARAGFVLTLLLVAACAGPSASSRDTLSADRGASPSARDRAAIQVAGALAGAWDRAVEADLAWGLVDSHEVRDLSAQPWGLWVATSGGLVAVAGGHVASRVTVAEGLLHNDVRHIALDAHGALWIGFEEGGCQLLSGGFDQAAVLSDCPEPIRDRHIAGIERGRVTPVAEAPGWADMVVVGRDGSVWTRARGWLADGEPGRSVSTSALCNGVVWTGGYGSGLAWLDDEGHWVGVSDASPVIETLTCHGSEVVAGGPAGAAAFVPGGAPRALELASQRHHVTLVESTSVGLLVGLSDGQLRLISSDSTESLMTPHTPRAAGVIAGAVWLGGSGGLVRLSADRQRVREIALPGSGANDVSAVASHEDTLALGFFREGIALWSGRSWQRVTRHEGLPWDEVNGLAFDESGTLWVATSRGVAAVSRDGRTAAVEVDDMACTHANSVLPLADGQIALATSCGVGFVDADTLHVARWEGRAEGLPHRIVYDLAEWDGVLVAATNDGLALRSATGWVGVRAGRSGLRDNWITAVESTPEGALAVGTYSGGFYLGEGPDSLHRVQGPGYVNLTAIEARGGEILVGGLSEGAWIVARAGQARQMQDCAMGRDVTGFADDRGALVVATRSGASLCR